MFARVKELSWWKQYEHTRESNEDAYRFSVNKGLFAVADGMGTVFFSRLWARILVDYFIDTLPLLGNDPFETEWWLRPAQREYLEKSPKVETLQEAVRSKAREGSAATLTTVRISAIDDDTSASAELLAFGDSCIFVGNPREQQVRVSFPNEKPSDFSKAPRGLPSLPWKYNRKFHQAALLPMTLQPDDIIILASDAVALWIISNGANTCANRWEAFQRIITLEPDDVTGPEGTWSHFIQQCRDANQMVNDDVTALVVTLSAHGEEKDRLGFTSKYPPPIIEQRKKEFDRAVAENRKDLIAITYGDGASFSGVSYDIARAQEVANALSSVEQIFLRDINSPDLAYRMKPVLETYGPLLVNEPCAGGLKHKLQQFGISLPSPQQASSEEKIDPASPTQNGQAIPPIPADTSSPSTAGIAQPTPKAGQPSPSQHTTQAEEKSLPVEQAAASPGRGQFVPPLSLSSIDKGDARARREQEERERQQKEVEFNEKIELIRKFYKSLYSGDAKTLMIAEKAIGDAAYPELLAYVDREKERVQAWDRLRAAMRRKVSSEEKLAAYDAARKVGFRYFPGDFDQQKQLAANFLEASKHGSDEAIFDAFNEIEHAGFESVFEFSEEEKSRIRHAKDSREALDLFRRLLSGGETGGVVTTQLVVKAFDKLLAVNRKLQENLSADERYRVELAQRFTRAYTSGMDEELIVVDALIYYSPFDIFFNREEETLVQTARQRVKRQLPSPTVARVDDHSITLEQYEKVYALTKIFLDEIIWQLHELAATRGYRFNFRGQLSRAFVPIIPAVDRRIAVLRKGLTRQAILTSMVDDLILQQSSIAREKAQEITTDAAHFAQQLLKIRNDQRGVLSRYEEALRRVMALFICYVIVDSDFQERNEDIEQWLSDQKRKMRISYPERAIIDESGSNVDPARSWVLRWPHLLSDTRKNFGDLFR